MLVWRFMSGPGPRAISTIVKWTICAVAAMGFLFDIYVVLVGPLILQPALTELGHLDPGTPEYRDWAGHLFWIPSLVGGFSGTEGRLSGRPFRSPPHSRIRLLGHGFRTRGQRGMAAWPQWTNPNATRRSLPRRTLISRLIAAMTNGTG